MDFSHIDDKKPTMVDVSEKATSQRIAKAEAIVFLGADILAAFEKEGWKNKKGPILDTAIIAGTMGAKKTAELIPFCHPIPLRSVKINIENFDAERLQIHAIAKANDQTGVEMEALTAAMTSALTIYDMCKSASLEICIEKIHLLGKRGGKRDFGEV